MLASKKRDVSDSVYGQINLPEICWLIIDTPQFQRLKNIKQLGTCFFVYPCASHDRKQHSIGVCHLATVALRKLIKNHEESGDPLNVTEKEVLMVQIAALCHDLGHGPLSHTFDGIYIPLMNPKQPKWNHEQASVEMFRRLVDCNPRVKSALSNILVPNDYIFIEEALSAIPQGNRDDPWPFKGCGPDKAFLYEMISNQRCGVDVDRFDYILRDVFYLNFKNSFDPFRLMENTRVLEVEYPAGRGVLRKVLGFRDKVMSEIENQGSMRATLHRQAYQHKTNKAVEQMYVDALRLCDNALVFEGSNGKKLPLSQTIYDMEAFEKVDDSVISRIKFLDSKTDENIDKAIAILNQIDRREFYSFVGQCSVEPLLMDRDNLVDKMCSLWPSINPKPNALRNAAITVERLKASLIVSVSDVHHGMKGNDPVSGCIFFKKNEPQRPRVVKDEPNGITNDSLTQPKSFRVHILHVFFRDRNDEVCKQAASLCFNEWCGIVKATQYLGGSLEEFSSMPLEINVSHLNTPPSSPKPGR